MMYKNSNIKPVKSRRKRRLKTRRIVILSLALVAVSLIGFLGWQVARGIAAITTGDEPATKVPKTTTTVTTSTTHPTLTVSAQVTSPRIMAYDVTHSSLLYSQNAEERCYPASLTKLVTAMVVTDACDAGEIFTVGSELSLVEPNSSRAGLQKGYQLTRDMILDALLLPSGNDAAYTIAAHIGRKISGNESFSDLEAVLAFTERMNDKAAELGAAGSHFSNPDGYYAPNHYTTASDMLKFARAVMQYDNLKQSMAKLSVELKLVSGQTMKLQNTNAILNPASPYYFQGATGMKTGFTDEAGNCVVASARRNGIDIIVVVMGGSTGDSRWRDAIELFQKAYAIHDIASTGAANTN